MWGSSTYNLRSSEVSACRAPPPPLPPRGWRMQSHWILRQIFRRFEYIMYSVDLRMFLKHPLAAHHTVPPVRAQSKQNENTSKPAPEPPSSDAGGQRTNSHLMDRRHAPCAPPCNCLEPELCARPSETECREIRPDLAWLSTTVV
jgi:hypothetical protein